MKKLILSLLVSLTLTGCRDDHSDDTQQKLKEAQAKAAEQGAKAGKLEGIAALLAIGCVVFLFIGAAAGSKTRRAFKDGTGK